MTFLKIKILDILMSPMGEKIMKSSRKGKFKESLILDMKTAHIY